VQWGLRLAGDHHPAPRAATLREAVL